MHWGRQVSSLLLLSTSSQLTLAGPIPKVGSQPPGFALQSQNGSLVRLADYRGKWVVIYFHPFPGRCPLEAVNFDHDQAESLKKNAVVWGISVDPVGSQKNCGTETVTGSLTRIVFFRVGSRNTFVIDPEGSRKSVFRCSLAGSAEQVVLTALTELQQARGTER